MIGRGGRIRAALAAAAVVASGALAVHPGIAAGSSCEYLELGRPGPEDNEIRIRDVGEVRIGRSGDRIVVSNPCTGGTPTVNNIDRIVILESSSRSLRLNLKDGPLGPGASGGGPGSEIQILLPQIAENPTGASLHVLTGKGSNRMTLGRRGEDEVVNLNPKRERRKDADVIFEEVLASEATALLLVGGGDDIIDARGTSIGTPSALDLHVHTDLGDDTVYGGLGSALVHSEEKNGQELLVAGAGFSTFAPGAGADRVRGGPQADILRPGYGRDDVRAGRGDDHVSALDEKVDLIHCGPGRDSVIADRGDRLRDCEDVQRG